MANVRQTLKQTDLFSTLEDTVLDAFINSATERHFSEGEILTAELVQGDEIYLILEGQISIGIELAGSDEAVEALNAGVGQFVGLVHFLEETVNHATETAVTDVTVLVWKASEWRKICEQYPTAGYRIAVAVAKMLTQRMLYFNMNILDNLSWGMG